MNEKETRDLIQKSIIETSDDFTDKLMQHIETKEVVEKTFVWSFKPMFSVLVVALLAISFTFYKYLKLSARLLDSSSEIHRTPIFLISIILLFFALNYILRLNEAFRISKSN